ncbi:MAG: YceI family protein [Cyclobacteriaceae bacterium]
MKKSLFFALALVVAGLGLQSFTTPAVGEYEADISSSELKWTGYHLAKSYAHWGYISLKSGQLVLDEKGIAKGEFVIDMNSISDKDIEKENDRAKLEGHLKSDDFFSVKGFPEAKLVIKESKKDGDVYRTVADLTIKGITKEIKFDTQLKSIDNNTIEATADFRVKRTDFNVMYGWNLENAMLDGEFRMEVKVLAKK